MRIEVEQVDYPFMSAFRIAYRTRSHAQTVVVELFDDGVVGRGEALGVSYHGETADGLAAQLRDFAGQLETLPSRTALQAMLPPGGARNAIDCALWDLEAKRLGLPAWTLAGLSDVRPLRTFYTLGIDTPEAMARRAAGADQYPLLKLKLAGDEDDLKRVSNVHRARPDADIILDANQAWDASRLRTIVPQLAGLGVSLIEQPMPVGADEILRDFDSPIPLCADESFQTGECFSDVIGKYQYINLKLDKTGGLTAALELARAARDHNLKLMVGCMGGSSLSMAPAFILGQLCDVVDLDSPLLLTTDVENAMRYDRNTLHRPVPELWG